MQLRIMHGEPIAIELKVDGKCSLDTQKGIVRVVILDSFAKHFLSKL